MKSNINAGRPLTRAELKEVAGGKSRIALNCGRLSCSTPNDAGRCGALGCWCPSPDDYCTPGD